MSQIDKPLASSKNTKTIVPFCDMPEEYVMVDRENADQYRDAQEIFAAHPDAKTLLLLYAKDGDSRSAYQSPATFDDQARDYPEKNHEVFYHVSGEKLVNLVLEVACNLSAYGQNNVMVPQGASDEEVRGMAYSRAQDVSNWDDPFEFQEDWSTVEGLRVNRVVEVVQEPGKNRARNVAIDIPVEFAPSRSGLDIFELLKAAERGTIIPPEVFMYAAARKTQEAGEDFAPEFMANLKSKAQIASENAVYKHMMDMTKLGNNMVVLNTGRDDVVEYMAGSVLRGCPDNPNEYKVYRDTYDPSGGVVLASVSDHNAHVLYKDFVGDTQMASNDLASFREQFTQVDQPAAEAVLVKHFGYKPVSTGDVNMSPSRSAGMDHS